MKLPRYPKYKDSGVKWLGQVPEHWAVLPIKRDMKFITSGSRSWAENYSDEGDLFIRIGNLTRHGVEMDLTDVQRVVVPSGTEGVRTIVKPGDVLFSITAYLGSVAVVPNDLGTAFVSQHIALVRLKKKRLLPKWVAYLTSSDVGKAYLDANGYGGTKIQLSLSDVASLIATAPPLEEQAVVISFLDLAIRKIEVLIAEQQRMIELLKEKRQAIISQAISKGLDLDAPMKPSGSDWIDGVPSSWRILKLKFLIKKIEQGWSPQCESAPAEEDEWSVLKVGCVNGGRFDPQENKKLPQTLEPEPKLGIRKEDVLISRANTRELVGSAAVALTSYPKHMLCDKLYRLMVDRDECNPHYVALFLTTPAARSEIELAATGASQSMVNIAQSVITNMVLPVPPLDEQKKIVEHIADENRKIESFINNALTAIALLQERRSALIAAAVTGQIDVRNSHIEGAHPVCQ